MPISDLLASISGETSQSQRPGSAANKGVQSTAKRKADDDGREAAPKVQRTVVPQRPGKLPLSTSSSGSRLAAASHSTNGSSSSGLPAVKSGLPAVKSNPATSSKHSSATPSSGGVRPGPNSRSSPAAQESKGEPKKRSFAEIMARAKAAQAALPTSVGRIQHKPLEKVLSKKERLEIKAEAAREAKRLARGTVSSGRRTPNSTRNGVRSTAPPPPRSGSTASKSVNGQRRSAPAGEPEKKVKKAAIATTGYTGTARPQPGASSKSNGSSSRPGSDPHQRNRVGYGGALSASRRRYDEEEEEMDDFIEYDDEEPEAHGYGGRGGHNSLEDDESDMEAGMSDIDDEERMAEYHARREDREQEALEQRLKREKEERKRRMMGR